MQALDYDPYRLIPDSLPPHPRTLLTPARLVRAQANIRTADWAQLAFNRLCHDAQADLTIPAPWSDPKTPEVGATLTHALKNALAALLTGEARYRDEARRVLRAVAQACAGWSVPGWPGSTLMAPLTQHDLRWFAMTYDTLAATPLPPEEDALFRAVLADKAQGLDACGHCFCGNHNSWNIVARLAVAAALGDRRVLHDALYGCDRDGRWRYGLVHQIRHDLLADGMHWERTVGYHYYSLMAFTEIADLCDHLGIDVWHLQLPALPASEGHDLHRDYSGPDVPKRFQTLYDAPFYQMFVNRDFSLLHDSGLANFRGTWIWGVVYDLAYQAYRDPKYAWLINLMERENPQRKVPGLPVQLQTWAEYYDFLRIERDTYPDGEFSLVPDQTLGTVGRHVHGCSLFPAHGSVVLRSDPEDPQAPGAYLFFGPHSAGHQAPAALHLDLHAGGRLRTDAALSDGYGDPLYLTWVRTTIAHNTVTMDATPMYPYDQETESIWEADIWHDRISDGTLELFQPGASFQALRAVNENVYPGVRLDRTVILTRHFALDVFRVLSAASHQYDWALHVMGVPTIPPGDALADLGSARGYRHLRNARELTVQEALVRLHWHLPNARTTGLILPPAEARLFIADDPPPRATGDLGELEPPPARAVVIVRAQAMATVFISLWYFDACATEPPELEVLDDPPAGDILLATMCGDQSRQWRLPFQKQEVVMIGQ